MISVKKELLPAIALSCILLGCSSKNTPAETTTNSMATTAQTTSTTTSSTSETTINSTEASSEETTVTEATTQAQATSGKANLSLGYDIIVNKKYALPSTYAPEEDPTAGQQVRALIHRMQELGYPISNTYSGYRSYDYQTKFYNNYVAVKDKSLQIPTLLAQDIANTKQASLLIFLTLTETYSTAQNTAMPSTGFIHMPTSTDSSSDSNPARKPSPVTKPKHGT